MRRYVALLSRRVGGADINRQDLRQRVNEAAGAAAVDSCARSFIHLEACVCLTHCYATISAALHH